MTLWQAFMAYWSFGLVLLLIGMMMWPQPLRHAILRRRPYLGTFALMLAALLLPVFILQAMARR